MALIRLFSWNVNGFRAVQKKGFWESFESLSPDVLAIQETKTDGEKMVIESQKVLNRGLDIKYFSATMKKGYSGVANISKVANPTIDGNLYGSDDVLFEGFETAAKSPVANLILEDYQLGLGIEKFDEEGRIVVCKYKVADSNFRFTLINGYYPQGGRGQHRIDYKIEFYKDIFKLAKGLSDSGENVILCGDLNTTVGDIDLARPKENKKTTGCLPEEREALAWLTDGGFLDSFRHFYPDKEGVYSYWDQITKARERNVGWRIDYFLVDKKIIDKVKSVDVLTGVMGSDHCPVFLELEV